jgi:hypothetical protein
MLDFNPHSSGDRNLMRLGMLLVLLQMYNCTLKHINVNPPGHKAPLMLPRGWASGCRELRSFLSHNLGTRRVYMNHAGLEHLEQMDPTLFVLTLEWVSSHPYLIQRILCQANVDQFAGLMYPPVLSGMLPIAPMAPVLPDPQPDQAGKTAAPTGASQLLTLWGILGETLSHIPCNLFWLFDYRKSGVRPAPGPAAEPPAGRGPSVAHKVRVWRLRSSNQTIGCSTRCSRCITVAKWESWARVYLTDWPTFLWLPTYRNNAAVPASVSAGHARCLPAAS